MTFLPHPKMVISASVYRRSTTKHNPQFTSAFRNHFLFLKEALGPWNTRARWSHLLSSQPISWNAKLWSFFFPLDSSCDSADSRGHAETHNTSSWGFELYVMNKWKTTGGLLSALRRASFEQRFLESSTNGDSTLPHILLPLVQSVLWMPQPEQRGHSPVAILSFYKNY